jgi:hypothetical protein
MSIDDILILSRVVKRKGVVMLPIESFWGFITGLVTYGGGSTVIAYLCFQFFGKSWLESRFAKELEGFRHQKDLELQKLRFEIDALLSGRIKLQERDFAILPEAWSKLNTAHKNLAGVTSSFQSYPDLNLCSKDELDEFLESSEFTESIKKKITESQKPLVDYIEVITRKRIGSVRTAISDFKDYVDANGIFLPPVLKSKFEEIAFVMWNAITTKEVGHESKDWKMQKQSFTSLQEDILPKIKTIESDINEVLTSHARLKS